MADNCKIEEIPTAPIADQKPGTSGEESQGVHVRGCVLGDDFFFTALEGMDWCTLVLGGDGRYWNKEASQIILKIAAANGVGKVLIGKGGILSTPAVSAVIRARKAYGGIVLTASHNPGGPENDFGIKYNISNGGPAPESVTNRIFDFTKTIKEIRSAQLPEIDLTTLGERKLNVEGHDFVVSVIDSTEEYVHLLKSIFDFNALRELVSNPQYKLVYDTMHGVTGPYCKRIFVQELGAPEGSVFRSENLPDFGGAHPDPNLTYAPELVKMMYSGEYDFGAASDGDGDRNMVLGRRFFVSPSDSLAVIAANSSAIPYFGKGVKGVARSMPTSAAVDTVAQKLGLEMFEVPTGWKFFGNLMDAGRIQLCGEESFGTGSDHIREKDGIWAVLCWLSIIAHKSKEAGKLVSVEEIVKEHWRKFGRNFYCRYDYEEVETEKANAVISHLRKLLSDPATVGSVHRGYTVKECDDYTYTDPIDKSVSAQQGIRFQFTDGSRVIFRLSGTGSTGATIRVYMDQYEPNHNRHEIPAQDALRDLIAVALDLSQISKFTGREKPTVIT